MEENSLLIYYFIAAVVILAVSFTVLYFISNPLDKSNSIVSYPFAVGVKPNMITEKDSVTITISELNSASRNQSNNVFILYIVDPVGNVYNYSAKSLSFPGTDNKIKLEKGQYSVLLASNKNIQNMSTSAVHFDVVLNPFITSFSNFAFTSGLPVTIGLIVSVLTTLYEFASTKRNEGNLKLYEHSKWTLEKSKYYMDLVANSKRVRYLFEISEDETQKAGLKRWQVSFRNTKNSEYDKTKLLYSIMRFYASILNFRKVVNVYYFDDVLSEDFLSKLEEKILSLYDYLIDGDMSDLKKFLSLEMHQLLKNKEFSDYSNRAYKKIQENKIEGKEEFNLQKLLFYYHFTYYKVLFVSVNDAFIVTYSSPSLLHKFVSHYVSSDENLLDYVLDALNKRFYKRNRRQYFRLTIRRKDLLKRSGVIRKIKGIIKDIFVGKDFDSVNSS